MQRLNSLSLTAILLAIFIPHLLLVNYSLFSFEVGFFAAISTLVGFGFGQSLKSKYVFGIVLGFCVYFFLDAYFFSFSQAGTVLIFCVFGVPLLMRLSDSAVQLIVLVFSIVFIIPELFGAPETIVIERPATQAPATPESPPKYAYIHLILDEQMSPLISPEKMPADFQPDDFFAPYIDNDFKVYGVANSHDSSTVYSLSAIFGLTTSKENVDFEPAEGRHSFGVLDHRLLRGLSDLGYATTVYESTYLGLCGDVASVTCRTFSRISNMQSIQNSGLPLLRRLEMAVLSLYEDYAFHAKTVMLVEVFAIQYAKVRKAPFPTSHGYFARPVGNLGIFRDIADQAREIKPGEAIIAHLFLPHFPYVLDRNCVMEPRSEWGYPLRNSPSIDTDQTYRTFWEQTVCTSGLINDILAQVEGRDDIVFIVHGDHGARIFVDTEFANDPDSYGTFLAFKAPEMEPGYSAGPIELQETILRDLTDTFGLQP